MQQDWSGKGFEGRVGRQVCTLTGHSTCGIRIAFSPDGTRIVSGSLDKLVKIWDAQTGAEVSILARVRWGR